MKKRFKGFKPGNIPSGKILIAGLGVLALGCFFFFRVQPPAKKVSFPPGPKIVFVVDDMGYTDQHDEDLTRLGSKVTYAVLPRLKFSRHFGELGKKNGTEVILHLPLQSIKGNIPGRGLITVAMPDDMIREELAGDLDTVPNVTGVNNHMGSLGTTDPRVMGIILAELKRRHLFFLDSLTSPQSVGYATAVKLGIPAFKRSTFLDNVDEPAAIEEEVRQAAAIAKKKGYAVAIGHYRYNTFKVLEREIPKLEKDGFQVLNLELLGRYLKTRQEGKP